MVKNTTSFTVNHSQIYNLFAVKHGQKYDLINFTVKHGQKYNLMYGQTLSKIQPHVRSNIVKNTTLFTIKHGTKINLIYGETLSKNTTSFTVKHGQKYDLINFTVKHGQKYNLINFTVKVTGVFSLTFYYWVTNAFMKTQLIDWKGNSSPVLIDAYGWFPHT